MNFPKHLTHRDKINLLDFLFKKFGMNEGIGKYCFLNDSHELLSIFDRDGRTYGFWKAKTWKPDQDSLKKFLERYPDFNPSKYEILSIDEDGVSIIPCAPKTLDMILAETINEMNAMDIVEAMEFVLSQH